MHHAHAAHAGALRVADELTKRLARFLGAQAVQVDLPLHRPMAAPQLRQYIGADAGAAKAQVFIHLQQRAGVEFVRDGFAQHGLLVALALQRLRRHRGRRVHRPPMRAQRLCGADGARKQVLLGARLLLGGRAHCGFLGGAGLGLSQLLLQRLQVLQRFDLHTNPFSAIESAAPGATMT